MGARSNYYITKKTYNKYHRKRNKVSKNTEQTRKEKMRSKSYPTHSTETKAKSPVLRRGSCSYAFCLCNGNIFRNATLLQKIREHSSIAKNSNHWWQGKKLKIENWTWNKAISTVSNRSGVKPIRKNLMRKDRKLPQTPYHACLVVCSLCQG